MRLMATHPGIVVLNKDRDDPTGIAVDVYDHAHPAIRPQSILTQADLSQLNLRGSESERDAATAGILASWRPRAGGFRSELRHRDRRGRTPARGRHLRLFAVMLRF